MSHPYSIVSTTNLRRIPARIPILVDEPQPPVQPVLVVLDQMQLHKWRRRARRIRLVMSTSMALYGAMFPGVVREFVVRRIWGFVGLGVVEPQGRVVRCCLLV